MLIRPQPSSNGEETKCTKKRYEILLLFSEINQYRCNTTIYFAYGYYFTYVSTIEKGIYTSYNTK